MPSSRRDTLRYYAAATLCHILIIVSSAHLASLVTAAPTSLSALSLVPLEPCEEIDCNFGCAVPDPMTGACVCPGPRPFPASPTPATEWKLLILIELAKIYEYLTHILPSWTSLTRRPLHARHRRDTESENATATQSVESPAQTAFIPPPSTDITPGLIQQSLSQQPQTLGQISSVQPFLRDGVIQFTMNLVGSASANSMLLNASVKIPASTIGENEEPSLVVVPQTVNSGAEVVVTKYATIIAINMYSNKYLTYWVMLPNRTLVSLLSDSRVHDIERISPNTSALSIIPWPSTEKKRDTRSVFTSATTSHIDNADAIARRASLSPTEENAAGAISKRGLAGVNSYNAKMTQTACAAMECTLNGGKPLWNTFTRSCYCETDREVWTVNPSADVEVSSG